MSEPARFARTFTALPVHIDALGHVNNTVWVQWIQDLATAHWDNAARTQDWDAFYWVVVRHEIDYRGNIGPSESVTGTTWIEGPAQGATALVVLYDRPMTAGPDGKPLDPSRNRVAVLVVLGRNPATGDAGPVVVGGVSDAAGGAPGPYGAFQDGTVT